MDAPVRIQRHGDVGWRAVGK